MKVISTNIGKPTIFLRNGNEEMTGIFKYPISEPLKLGKSDVARDSVIDRIHHGGEHKACYLFSSDQYPYWKSKYPELEWNWGMFGENLTVEGLDEDELRIGDIYKIGTALVQISQPREPCYKLGVRFKNQAILKQFIDHGYPGTYVRVIEEGKVKTGDELILVKRSTNELTIKQFYLFLYAKTKEPEIARMAFDNEALPLYKRERLRKFLNK